MQFLALRAPAAGADRLRPQIQNDLGTRRQHLLQALTLEIQWTALPEVYHTRYIE